jgi:TonB family protein
MRKGVRLLLLSMPLLLMSSARALTPSSVPTSDRKIAARVPPVYPDLAKRMHIHGVVRVEAVVKPNGAVKSTRVLGGNPVLVDAALNAVSKWKFDAAQAETTEIVQVTFEGQ